MIQELVNKWDKNNHKLDSIFSDFINNEDSPNYKDIVNALFENIINDNNDSYENYDTSKMTVIDDGDYQGTLVFITPKNTYQPSIEDYLVMNTYYGSCSGCDTLESILYDTSTLEEQIKELKTLSLHLIQGAFYLGQ